MRWTIRGHTNTKSNNDMLEGLCQGEIFTFLFGTNFAYVADLKDFRHIANIE